MRVDYDSLGWRFISLILNENNLRLSRTHKGVSDTSASETKRPLLLSGESLRQKAVENEERLHRYIWETRASPAPNDATDVMDLLGVIADQTNQGLLPEGRLRTWDVPYGAPGQRVAAPDLPRALEGFCADLARRWHELREDPALLAAWAEWELNGGPLHPFYDGCGRISRSFSAALLVRSSWLLPLFDGQATYFANGMRGGDAFLSYYRERIEACREWLAENACPQAVSRRNSRRLRLRQWT